MKRTILISILAVLFVSACSTDKEILDTDYSSRKGFTLEAFIENSSTKTSLTNGEENLKIMWSEGDSFILYDGTSSHTFTRDGATSKFHSSTTPDAGGEWFCYYPASAVESSSASSFSVVLPSIQTAVADNIAGGVFPMAATREGNGVKFRNLCALVVFKIKGCNDDEGLKLQKATITADKPIAGDATIPSGTAELTVSSDGSKMISIDCSALTLSTSKTTDIYAAIPAGTYTSLSITITAEGGKVFEHSMNGTFTFSRSNAYYTTLDEKPFSPDKEKYMQCILDAQILSGCSPYVSYVYDVDYAPGQFTNTLPSGMSTKDAAIAATETSIVGRTDQYVHLGGWGGSVTVGFDHPILNMEGADFRGYGNAFQGSSEPGVYYVAQKDADGKPAKWYLIKHSMYDYAIHNYEITYYKPVSETQTQYKFFAWKGDYASTTTSVLVTVFNKNGKEIPSADPDAAKWYLYNDNIYKEGTGSTAKLMKLVKANTVSGVAASEKEIPETYETYPVVYNYTKVVQAFDNYIFWKDNLGHNGYECKNSYHKQSYWPEYAGETITIVGEYLPVNSFDTSGDGSSYVQDAKWWGFPLDSKEYGLGAWGYCDNYANTDPLSTIDIDWAVDENGKKVELSHIDFIKVQSGVHKQSGWVGEVSTEFCGVEDMHIKGEKITPDITTVPDINNIPRSKDAQQPETGLLYWSYNQIPESDIPEYAK